MQADLHSKTQAKLVRASKDPLLFHIDGNLADRSRQRHSASNKFDPHASSGTGEQTALPLPATGARQPRKAAHDRDHPVRLAKVKRLNRENDPGMQCAPPPRRQWEKHQFLIGGHCLPSERATEGIDMWK